MTQPLLRVRDICVEFPLPGRGWPWSARRALQAVRGVSFDLAAGQTLGIVGESGSGKSTLARAIVGTVRAAGGRVEWNGRNLLADDRDRVGSEIQMIFQDPLAALNPRLTVGDTIAEPLRTHHRGLSQREIADRVAQMMDRVGLSSALRNRYPHEFSGGQCQRVGIARALITDPRLVVCDEPVSALDVSVQAQVINLLRDLQSELGVSLIFISHDLAVARHISHEIMVMYLGRAVEHGPVARVISDPLHPYTQALIAAAPIPDPVVARARTPTAPGGEIPSPLNVPSGCGFRSRCALARPVCATEVPVLSAYNHHHLVACPIVSSGLSRD